ncbi:heme exporter protein CcmD [Hyphomonas johnsonii]|uniref:Heme exporter protein D n=1 Tax=Hyphomonas johnsonii MHS-2 TaxID=1280950 RepID=A0A059FMI2_9PROT|nr:heme exporter protein CcmD [Hyphomonas johnsonii]KCZ91854.1 putative lipoprotein [Hyphomonas johnsonii MHS-2]
MEIIPAFDKNAAYIWACYGLGLVLIGGALLGVVLRARAARAELARLTLDEGDKE